MSPATIALVVEVELGQGVATESDALLFSCCKTPFKPYDIVVTAVLVAAQHHFGAAFVVQSDGDLEQWRDGMALCHDTYGYGNAFHLD